MRTDEQLIELVKQYPVLYNTSLSEYRDINMRNNAWEVIAEQMNSTVEDVKTKWGKLRNCFTNALKRRRKKSGQASTIPPWRYEKQMEFLMSHVEGRQNVTVYLWPNEITNDDDSAHDSELQSDYSARSPSPEIKPSPISSGHKAATTSSSSAVVPATPRTTRRTNKNDSDTKILTEIADVLKSSHETRPKRTFTDMDENDYFFLSMSKQLKKLPEIDQSEIKFQLHKLIHDSEMKMLNKI